MFSNYIVRIYRCKEKQHPARRSQDAIQLEGVIEAVETGEQQAFHGCDELWEFLANNQTTNETREKQ